MLFAEDLSLLNRYVYVMIWYDITFSFTRNTMKFKIKKFILIRILRNFRGRKHELSDNQSKAKR